MKYSIAFCSAILSVASFGANAQISYEIGHRIEIELGEYVTLLEEVDGWKVWLRESRDVSSCSAAKPAIGNSAPSPINHASFFSEGSFAEIIQLGAGHAPNIEWIGMKPHYTIKNTNFSVSGSSGYKIEGDKFLKSHFSVDPDIVDGKKIEFRLVGYLYPEIKIDYRSDYGFIDMTGAITALESVINCTQQANLSPS